MVTPLVTWQRCFPSPKNVFNQSPEGEEVLRDSMDPNNAVRATGKVEFEAPLQMPDQAITLQVRDGKMSTTDGPFMETKEMLGGIVVIEARDIRQGGLY